tara:strand:+ start:354 stop:554 length:201 start_codon:yes stop_codon:yes gene_type:complete
MGVKMTKQGLRDLIKEVIKEETDYQKFFDSALKKFGVSSPDELEGEKKKEFFDYVDKNWEAENETD